MAHAFVWLGISAFQLTVICSSTHPVAVRSLPSLWHTHHPNVVGGASLQCSQDDGYTTDSPHLPFWWGVHLLWSSGVLDSVGHSSPSKSLPLYCQSWRSVLYTRSDTDTHHLAGELRSWTGCSCWDVWTSSDCTATGCCGGSWWYGSDLIITAITSGTCTWTKTKQKGKVTTTCPVWIRITKQTLKPHSTSVYTNIGCLMHCEWVYKVHYEMYVVLGYGIYIGYGYGVVYSIPCAEFPCACIVQTGRSLDH